jgi:hypothetical protein
MAAISNPIFRYRFAARLDAVKVARRQPIFRSRLRDVTSSAFRLAQEILCALWMCAVLAFSLLLAAGFVA